MYNSYIDSAYAPLLSIGDNVTLTNATVLLHDASTKRATRYTKIGKVSIGNNVFIGYGSIILPGTTVGNNVIVGAGTVVRGNVPDNCVIAGNPYKVICTYDQFEKKQANRLESTPYIDISEKNSLVGFSTTRNIFGFID